MVKARARSSADQCDRDAPPGKPPSSYFICVCIRNPSSPDHSSRRAVVSIRCQVIPAVVGFNLKTARPNDIPSILAPCYFCKTSWTKERRRSSHPRGDPYFKAQQVIPLQQHPVPSSPCQRVVLRQLHYKGHLIPQNWRIESTHAQN